jgi:hypothetical protein
MKGRSQAIACYVGKSSMRGAREGVTQLTCNCLQPGGE